MKEPPPAYSELADQEYNLTGGSYSDGGESSAHRELRPLGLLNRMWEVDCPYIEREWGYACRQGLNFVLTQQGERIWARFDFGILTGVMLLKSRPCASSCEPLEFSWSIQETGEGVLEFGGSCRGEMSFLGGMGLLKVEPLVHYSGTTVYHSLPFAPLVTKPEVTSTRRRCVVIGIGTNRTLMTKRIIIAGADSMAHSTRC